MGKMSSMGKCKVCGRVQQLDPEGICLPCSLELREHEVPQELLDMRNVYGGFQDGSPGSCMMQRLLETEPDKFLQRKSALERDYRLSLKNRQEKKERKGKKKEEQHPEKEVAEDEGQLAVEELIGRMLKEANDGRRPG